MLLFLASFVAGALTVAAPCILPLLPVIVGGTIVRTDGSKETRWYRPLVIALSLAGSVVAFTLLLKASTALLGVPQMTWQLISGLIIILFGFSLLLPRLWARLMVATGLEVKSNRLLGGSRRFDGTAGDIMLGAALGPVFASCSPTYALIVASVLPASFLTGLAYLAAYALGLAATLLIIAFAGQLATQKLGWLGNPSGWFRKFIGLLFIAVGLAILFGLDRDIQALILEKGLYDPIANLERLLMRR